MKEDPIISGGLVKVALVLLVAGALGVGAYLVVGGDAIDIDLPDLPEIDTLGDETTTKPQDTELQDTTIDGGGKGTAIPPEAIEAQKLAGCLREAEGDPDRVLACLDRFQ